MSDPRNVLTPARRALLQRLVDAGRLVDFRLSGADKRQIPWLSGVGFASAQWFPAGLVVTPTDAGRAAVAPEPHP